MEKQKEYLPAKKTWEVKYQAGEVEITLNPEIIKNYLVRGKPELVTMQEMTFFMGICRARGLNPFAGDCYLIKYTQNDPAAIITSIDFKRARAAAQENCQGWQKGVIVKKQDGTLRYSNGIIMDGETLIGGWFEATPRGWMVPFKLEVNLKGYLKKTSEGKITRFWQEENQPTMIAKVAESQGLSAAWPRDLGKLYTTDEIPEETIPDGGPLFEMEQNGSGTLQPADFSEISKTHLQGDTHKEAALLIFLTKTADLQKSDIETVKGKAMSNQEEFWKAFDTWYAKQSKPKQSTQPTKQAKGKAQADQAGGGVPFPDDPIPKDDRPSTARIMCPETGSEADLGYCKGECITSVDCQAWR